ncbi:MAG: SBBP repeat-containing protein, partial [Ignavibacteria bacterium]
MKTKILFEFFAVCLLLHMGLNFSNAQVTKLWASYYNSPTNASDIAKAIAVDNEGNIYVTGESPSTGTGIDFATVKYNSAGVQQWSVRYNRLGSLADRPSGIVVDDAGNVYVTGVSSLGAGYSVLTTVKYNSAGIQQWAARKGDTIRTSAPSPFKSPIGLDNSGNIYVGGITRVSAIENGSYLLIKYDSNGDSLWSRTYDGTSLTAGLGSSVSVVKVAGNYVYVTGKSYDMSPNRTYATTIKYDLDGVLQWIVKDSLINGSDDVKDMDIDPAGNVIVTCDFGFNILTIKYDPEGNRLWRTYYTGIAGDHYDEVTGVDTDLSGNIFITGNSDRSVSDRDFLTLKYDINGNQLWEKFYNGSGNDGDYSNDIHVDNAGNCYITGTAYQTGFHTDIATIKYNTAGVQQWSITFDGENNTDNDYGNAIVVDSSGNVIVTGLASRPAGHGDDFATVKFSQASSSVLNMTAYIQGFYDPGSNSMIADTASVYLRSSTAPYNKIDSAKGVLSNSGTGSFTFNNAAGGTNYYLALLHRNSI